MEVKRKKHQVLLDFEDEEELQSFQVAMEELQKHAEETYQNAAGAFLLGEEKWNDLLDAAHLGEFERVRQMAEKIQKYL